MKFKTNFFLPTSDFKSSERKTLVVTMPDEEDLLNANFIEYKIQIPDFMFDELKDTEPQFKTEYDVNNSTVSGCFAERDLTRKFKKTQTSKSLEVLMDYIYGLTQFILNKYSLETSTSKKKLFIRFDNKEQHERSCLNGAYKGYRVYQSFSFFTGYEIMTDKYSSLLDRKVKKAYITKICYATGSFAKHDTGFKEKEDLSLPLCENGQSMEDFEQSYSIIDWTQEREDFCKKIQDSFINLGKELSGFLKDITEEKFKALMESNLKMLQ